MKVSFIEASGFRGYREKIRVDCPAGFAVISGRNGSGKSSLCDAVEFALTGSITKYGTATAGRETVADYIWWRGEPSVRERYVRVGFVNETGEEFSVERRLGRPDAEGITQLRGHLYHVDTAPEDALEQLCRISIIRDELITGLSLDLGESDRFQLLRDALGSPSATPEIRRAQRLVRVCEDRKKELERQVALQRDRLQHAIAAVETERSHVVADPTLQAAREALENWLDGESDVLALIAAARAKLAEWRMRINRLEATAQRLRQLEPELEATSSEDFIQSLTAREERVRQLRERSADLERTKEQLRLLLEREASLNAVALDLVNLIDHGSRLGLHEAHCPLCAAERTQEEFEAGVAAARTRLSRLSSSVGAAEARRRELETQIASLDKELAAAERQASDLRERLEAATESRQAFAAELTDLGLKPSLDQATLGRLINDEIHAYGEKERALAVIETSATTDRLGELEKKRDNLRVDLERLEHQLAIRTRSEANAKILHDATRRASGETLDERLASISPLLGELYQRLRPHPRWTEIDYKLRGDVQRFLRLEVGEEGDVVNPQFLFSSGQRRATGLAFLISVYLATTWSRFDTLILDDPVQHIDDFRAMHLVEMLSAISRSGRQILCAIEDDALAGLLCRRLSQVEGFGSRVELGVAENGALAVISQVSPSPLAPGVLRMFNQVEEAG